MTKCYDCEFFRYFNKSDIETIVNCDLMFEYYQVSIEKFEDVFVNDAPCEHFEKLSEDTNQELI